jgi:hypothetical protein
VSTTTTVKEPAKRGPAPHSVVNSHASTTKRKRHYDEEQKEAQRERFRVMGRDHRRAERALGQHPCALCPHEVSQEVYVFWYQGYVMECKRGGEL